MSDCAIYPYYIKTNNIIDGLHSEMRLSAFSKGRLHGLDPDRANGKKSKRRFENDRNPRIVNLDEMTEDDHPHQKAMRNSNARRSDVTIAPLVMMSAKKTLMNVDVMIEIVVAIALVAHL